MSKQHWEQIMETVNQKRLPPNVNLLEVQFYMYACYLEHKITLEEWNQFVTGLYHFNPSLLLVS
jgi:hypothetical protein